METNKIKLQLGVLNDLNEISSAVISCLTCEYLIDLIRSDLRKYGNEANLKDFIGDFADLIDNTYDVSFSSFTSWQMKKSESTSDFLSFVQDLDKYLTEKGIIEERTVINEIQGRLTEFLLSLSKLKITQDELDLSDVKLEKEYIVNTLEQVRLLDEGILLSDLASMQLDFIPLDTSKFSHKYIEDKLKRLNKITDYCDNTFENSYSKLLNQVVSMYGKFYNVCYGNYTDGEKAEKARSIVKTLNPHRLLLDKLENKLSEANELKRQLTIHEKKLDSVLKEKVESTNQKVKENAEEKDVYEHELDEMKFAFSNYSTQIENSISKVNEVEEKIAKHYKVLDQLEISLKTAIPSEDDLNKYSSLGYKFQELLVKLELSKSQARKSEKELLKTIDTAEYGLGTLTKYASELKDLYLRNSMLTAIFRAVNDLNDFATSQNKATQLNQINFVADRLSKYSEKEQAFSSDMLAYRKISNNLIRDISITLGKPIIITRLFEIIDMIDIAIKQIDTLQEKLEANHKEQITYMKSIMEM